MKRLELISNYGELCPRILPEKERPTYKVSVPLEMNNPDRQLIAEEEAYSNEMKKYSISRDITLIEHNRMNVAKRKRFDQLLYSKIKKESRDIREAKEWLKLDEIDADIENIGKVRTILGSCIRHDYDMQELFT